jgi:multisubunit Na+/H+ antiporter MnhC subunit
MIGRYVLAITMSGLMVLMGIAMTATSVGNNVVTCGYTPGFCPNPPGCEHTTGDINEC